MMLFSEGLSKIKKDAYGGITVNKDQLPETREKFAVTLEKSLARWKEVRIHLLFALCSTCNIRTRLEESGSILALKKVTSFQKPSSEVDAFKKTFKESNLLTNK